MSESLGHSIPPRKLSCLARAPQTQSSLASLSHPGCSHGVSLCALGETLPSNAGRSPSASPQPRWLRNSFARSSVPASSMAVPLLRAGTCPARSQNSNCYLDPRKGRPLRPPSPCLSPKWRRRALPPRLQGDCQVVRSRNRRSRLGASRDRDAAACAGAFGGAERRGWYGVRGSALGLAPAWLQLRVPRGWCRCNREGHLRT